MYASGVPGAPEMLIRNSAARWNWRVPTTPTTSPRSFSASTFSVVVPAGRAFHTGVSGAHGSHALNGCAAPSSDDTVNRYEAAPDTVGKSNAGAAINCLAL